VPTAVESVAPSFQGLLQRQDYTEISFLYQRIDVTWTDGGKTNSDSWSSPT
jgi:hypothetical protein